MRCKIHSVRHTSLTLTWVNLSKRPEMNCKPALFFTFMNNGKVFPSLGGMQLSVS